ncbi:glycosyltransferase family 9 protein [Rhodocytophaga rosea]|uniref:Glycosyltransferase family 9 protein n=1 Tax=Rhodocytophaga rosea TaxID=2704465 RepID=A0A6C0GCN6_9BACT|nr:glycosyltransferase family 9 protein [Rhodocytophaga rosea]QHT65731.1 glycosyltransferase family 9 protein [Rhodocytophaga rosea]
MVPQSILIIQTAFIGDVILATSLIEKLRQYYPEAQLDFLVRKGNEGVLQDHPYMRNILIWNKKQGKYKSLYDLLQYIRSEQYDVVVNLQRFASMGFLTALSGAKQKIGFDKNPFSFFFDIRVPHRIGEGNHETERNQALLTHLTDTIVKKPRLYPAKADYEAVLSLQHTPYICIAPTSVWFTKQFPQEKWIELINQLPEHYTIYLLGSPADHQACEDIKTGASKNTVVNLAGKLSLLQSAALIEKALMNYVNDSAPMHMASAMNAPTCAVYCSTIPAFGFGPLSGQAFIIEKQEPLYCRPCGLHGYKACPEGHFKCAHDIQIPRLTRLVK